MGIESSGNYQEKADRLFAHHAEMICADLDGGAGGSLAGEHYEVIASGKEHGGEDNLNNLAVGGSAGPQKFPGPTEFCFPRVAPSARRAGSFPLRPFNPT